MIKRILVIVLCSFLFVGSLSTIRRCTRPTSQAEINMDIQKLFTTNLNNEINNEINYNNGEQ